MNGHEGAATAGAHAQAQHVLPQGWEASYDPHHQAWYYFNRSTGETSWTLPHAPSSSHQVALAHGADSSVAIRTQPSASAPAQKDAAPGHAHAADAAGSAAGPASTSADPGAAAGAPAPSAPPRSGWYYRDRSGVLHGPFCQDHLHAWRNYLPMDLLVWYVELGPAGGAEAAAAGGRGEPAGSGGGGSKRRRAQEQPCAESAAPGGGGGEVAPDAAAGGSQDGTHVQVAAVAEEAGALGLGSYEDDEDAEAGPAAAGSEALGNGGQPPAKKPRGESALGTAVGVDVEGTGTEPESEAVGSGNSEEAEADGDGTEGADDTAVDEQPQVQEPANAEEAIACGLPGIELAELLGDGGLLTDWRQRFPGASRGRHGVAPPAPVHDHWLRSAAAAAAAAHAHAAATAHYHAAYHGHSAYPAYGGAAAGDVGPRPPPSSREESMAEYAAAVLSGLPPDDEAVVLARQAAAAGRSLVDVVAFATSQASAAAAAGYEPPPVEGEEVKPPPVSEHGTATEYVRDPRSGRLTAVAAEAAPPSSAKALYGEFGNWMNPEQIEDYLAQAKQWRREKMPAIWAKKKLKEIREMKERKKKRQELLKWGPDL
ncbi:hypothetical protein HXX76_011491 [Chlamydomonas incerta]|uniref:WW domain-containing protein n=1 Tax=Chlamydomonas incerta TaxID=51695 RepID=A0A835SND4_CHLIN|nr:hypothetical protein HXX76_011491 [Chlamydomonas incerta]|eukprot:KAG2428791.1 hypothetical protein HXX76_011491 [Chlamydomonas incerta]